MADIDPGEYERDLSKAAAAASEHSGCSVKGGTPRPPRDSALGPTNNELDPERSGEGAVDKVVLIGLAVVVAPFTVLVIIGRVIGFF